MNDAMQIAVWWLVLCLLGWGWNLYSKFGTQGYARWLGESQSTVLHIWKSPPFNSLLPFTMSKTMSHFEPAMTLIALQYFHISIFIKDRVGLKLTLSLFTVILYAFLLFMGHHADFSHSVKFLFENIKGKQSPINGKY